MKNTLIPGSLWKLALAVGAASSLALATPGFAAGVNVIDFESYTTGTLSGSSTNAGGGNLTATHAFTGQDGWSIGSSTSQGMIVATSSTGSYVGGKALSGYVTPSSTTYIGANNLYILTSSYSFDLQAGTLTDYAYVGGWTDANNDTLFSGNETGVAAGLMNNGTFGIRGGSYGGVTSTNVSANTGDWYHVGVTLNYSSLTVTLDVTDLTTNSVVDLNGASAGTSWTSGALTSAQFNGDPASFTGLFARASQANLIDNITLATAVPEPTTWALAVGGLGALAMIRRRRAALL